MLSNRLAIAAIGIACVAAAGGGSYLATRHDMGSVAGLAATTDPASVGAAASDTIAPRGTETVQAPTVMSPPVQETEAVVGDPAPRPAAATEPVAPASARSRRTAAPARGSSRPSAAGTRASHDASQTSPDASQNSARNAAQPPSLDRTWPNGAASAPVPDAATGDQAGVGSHDEHQVADPPRAVEPPQPAFRELVVSAESVIGLQTDHRLSSERARVEDRVEARVARDVRVDGRVAIPAGTQALGSVMVVERGGKFKEQARLGIRFNTLVMADGTRLPITTNTVYRYGDAPGNGSAARIGGGAVVGTILGAIIGGGKGAAVGAAAGAGAGTAMAAGGDRSEATFPAGAEFTAKILSPVAITVEQ